MATVASVMNKVARECSVARPSSWIGVTEDSHEDLVDFLDDTIKELQKRVDWEEPLGADVVIEGSTNISSDTDQSTHELPTNFYRINRDDLAVYERTTTRRRGLPITTSGKWTALQSVGTAGAYRYWRITGYPGNYEISFFRPLGTNDRLTIAYMTDYWVASTSGTLSNQWTSDDDILLFDDRLVQLGVRWRWLRQKGLPYDDYLSEYEAYLSREAGDNRNIRKIVIGETGDEFRAPWDVPVPDFIPPSN